MSFTIPCFVGNLLVCNALVDLSASTNLMALSLYAKLDLGELKATRITIQLADRPFKYPIGVADNMPVNVDKFVFCVDFVILDMVEDKHVPLILGRPFLNTANAIAHVSKKQLDLGIANDRVTFSIDKAMRHTATSDDTCYFLDISDPCIKEEIYLSVGVDEAPLTTYGEHSQDPEEAVKEFQELHG